VAEGHGPGDCGAWHAARRPADLCAEYRGTAAAAARDGHTRRLHAAAWIYAPSAHAATDARHNGSCANSGRARTDPTTTHGSAGDAASGDRGASRGAGAFRRDYSADARWCLQGASWCSTARAPDGGLDNWHAEAARRLNAAAQPASGRNTSGRLHTSDAQRWLAQLQHGRRRRTGCLCRALCAGYRSGRASITGGCGQRGGYPGRHRERAWSTRRRDADGADRANISVSASVRLYRDAAERH
jgi:hypothetical protein